MDFLKLTKYLKVLEEKISKRWTSLYRFVNFVYDLPVMSRLKMSQGLVKRVLVNSERESRLRSKALARVPCISYIIEKKSRSPSW